MSKIQPLADRVLVKPMAAEEKTIGGIIIPDSAKEKPLRGEVIAVGEGTKDEKMHYAPKRRVGNFEISKLNQLLSPLRHGGLSSLNSRKKLTRTS